MYDPMQSAYKLVHSTETALVKINYDILSNLDANKCTVLVSPDLSEAFDTINYTVLLNRLHYMYVLPLNGSTRTLNRETTRCVLDTPFHKDGQ